MTPKIRTSGRTPRQNKNARRSAKSRLRCTPLARCGRLVHQRVLNETERVPKEVVIPEKLVRNVRSSGDKGSAFLAHLGQRLKELEKRWHVRAGSPIVPGGATAYLAPVTLADGGQAVIKINTPRPESRNEGDALRCFGGLGAIEVLADDISDQSYALLIERCVPGTPLLDQPDDRQLRAATGILRRLWRPPPKYVEFHPLDPAPGDDAAAGPGDAIPAGLDPRLVARAAELSAWLAESTADAVLLHGDFRAANVLAASREPWLAVDPKPLIGDRAYDAVSLVCQVGDLLRGPGVQRAITARIELLEERLGVDGVRIRGWAFVTAVRSCLSSLARGDRLGAGRCVDWAVALGSKLD